MSEVIRSAVCPMCGRLPGIVMSIEQAFCDTEGCPVFCWDMRVTPEQFRRNATVVDVEFGS